MPNAIVKIENVQGIPQTVRNGDEFTMRYDAHNVGPDDTGLAVEVFINKAFIQGHYSSIIPYAPCERATYGRLVKVNGEFLQAPLNKNLNIEIVGYKLEGIWVETHRVNFYVKSSDAPQPFPWYALLCFGGLIPAFRREK